MSCPFTQIFLAGRLKEQNHHPRLDFSLVGDLLPAAVHINTLAHRERQFCLCELIINRSKLWTSQSSRQSYQFCNDRMSINAEDWACGTVRSPSLRGGDEGIHRKSDIHLQDLVVNVDINVNF